MIIQSIAKLIHHAAGTISKLNQPKSKVSELQSQAEPQPLTLELNQSFNPTDSELRLMVVHQRNDVDPLYKRHDGFLRGSVNDRLSDQTSENISRWKLGRYVPHNSIDSLSTYFSPFAGVAEVSKSLNSTHAAGLSPTESMNMIMSSQLKMHILNRYTQEVGQQIQRREALSLGCDDIAAAEPQAFMTALAAYDTAAAEPQAFMTALAVDDTTAAEPQAFMTVLATDDTVAAPQAGATELDIDNEICIFDSEILKEFASSRYVIVSDPIEAELEPLFDFDQHSTAVEEKTPFQLLVGRRKHLIDCAPRVDQNFEPGDSKVHASEPVQSPPVRTAEMSSFDENRTYFAKPLPQYFGIQDVETLDLSLTFAGQELTEDPWISSNQPVSGDEAVSPIHAATADELECIRYIFSSDAQVQVLRAMAESNETPPYVLSQLAYHPDEDVRCAVADNTNAPIEARWMLALDGNQTVRYMVAENINTPEEVLAGLVKDESSYVSSRARRTLSRLHGTKVVSVKFGSNVLRLSAS